MTTTLPHHAHPADAGLPQAAAPQTMPGWHIFADLTPPELQTSRQARSIRIAVIAALVVVCAGVAVGYQLARGQAQDAAAAVTAEEATGQTLRDRQQEFANVTTLQATVDSAKQQLGALLASDVDIDALVGHIWAALPPGMTIDQITVTVPGADAGQAAAGDSGSGAAALDTSAAVHIGTVALAGSGAAIDDTSTFIDKLVGIKGVYSPFPTSNQLGDDGRTSYSLQFTLTDAALSHRFLEGGDGK